MSRSPHIGARCPERAWVGLAALDRGHFPYQESKTVCLASGQGLAHAGRNFPEITGGPPHQKTSPPEDPGRGRWQGNGPVALPRRRSGWLPVLQWLRPHDGPPPTPRVSAQRSPPSCAPAASCQNIKPDGSLPSTALGFSDPPHLFDPLCTLSPRSMPDSSPSRRPCFPRRFTATSLRCVRKRVEAFSSSAHAESETAL